MIVPGWQAFGQLSPRAAAIGGFVQAASRAAVRIPRRPRWAPRSPHVRINSLRVSRIKLEIDSSGVFVLIQNFLPCEAAIEGTKNAALRIRSVRMAKHAGENPAGIVRINDDGANLLSIAQSEMIPGTAPIERFINSVAGGKIRPAKAFAAAYVNHVRIRCCDSQSAD